MGWVEQFITVDVTQLTVILLMCYFPNLFIHSLNTFEYLFYAEKTIKGPKSR